MICQRSHGLCKQISLATRFPQWILGLNRVVRLCYWVNPYSLLQDLLASSVSEFFSRGNQNYVYVSGSRSILKFMSPDMCFTHI